MTTQVYLVMYVLMFIAAMQLRRHQKDHERGFKAPALSLLCIVGTIASVAAFFIGFVPPSQFESGSTETYILIVGGGVLIIGFLVPGITYMMRKPSWKTPDAVVEETLAEREIPTEPATGLGVPVQAQPLQGGADAEEIAQTEALRAPPPPSEPGYDPEQQPTGDNPKSRKLLYGVIGLVVGAALVYGLMALDERNKDEEAQAKADETIALMEAQGLVPPSKDLLVNLLGTDGGNACEEPGAALREAQHRASLSNGAAQVGVRPVIADENIVKGGLAILDVYCPDQAQEVREYLESLKYDDVVHQ
jgi:hypothetical protein